MNLLEYYEAIQSADDTWKRIVASLWILTTLDVPPDVDAGAWARLIEEVERDAGDVARRVRPRILATVDALADDKALFEAVLADARRRCGAIDLPRGENRIVSDLYQQTERR